MEKPVDSSEKKKGCSCDKDSIVNSFAGLILPCALLCSAICLQLMFIGFIRFSRVEIDAVKFASLTTVGRSIYLPERDLPIYLFFLSAAPLVSWLFYRYLRNLICRSAGKLSEKSVQLSLLVSSAFSYFLLFLLFPNTFVLSWAPPPVIICIALALAACQFAAVVFIGSNLQLGAAKNREISAETIKTTQMESIAVKNDRLKSSLFDMFVLTGLFLIFFIPNTAKITGDIFAHERMHHWDYFTVSQTLSFMHGSALGTDVYAQYGCGWTILLSTLAKFTPLSYGLALKTASFFECIYLFGVYWLLKEVTQSRFTALIGMIITGYLTVFCGVDPGDLKIKYPSSTIMRHALDIWTLLSFYLFFKSRKSGWMLLSWVLVGFALVFEIDTGIYLLVGASVSTLFTARKGVGFLAPGKESDLSKTLLMSLSGMCLVVLTCFGYVSRWHLNLPQFWSGIFEVFTLYPSGMSMLPISGQAVGMMIALPCILIYATTTCYGFLKYRTRQVCAQDEFLFITALYGSLFFVAYIGRSHYFNIFHSCAPLVVITAVALSRGVRKIRFPKALAGIPKPGLVVMKISAVILTLSVIYASSPQARTDPGLLHEMMAPTRIDPALCLFPDTGDVCLPESEKSILIYFQLAVARAKALVSRQKTVAFFSNDDTALYLASGAKPWGRYCRTMQSLLTKDQLQTARLFLAASPPDYVFFGTTPLSGVRYYDTGMDVWRIMHADVESRYELIETVGSYEIWRRRGEGIAGR